MSDENNSDRESLLPRSIYVPQEDPRRELRETIESIFSDKFMISLSFLMLPVILLPFITSSPTVIEFLDICDWSIIVLFILEYTSKLYAAQNRWRHFRSPWALLDLTIIVLPFVQFIPLLGINITGSPSLLFRLLRLPRALAVGSRVVGARLSNGEASTTMMAKRQEATIRGVSGDLKTVYGSLTWEELSSHLSDGKMEWLDLSGVSEEDLSLLGKLLKIPESHFTRRLVDEMYPHVDYLENVSFVLLQSGELKYPEHASHYLTISRTGILVICYGTKIISVSRYDKDMFSRVLGSLGSHSANGNFAVSTLYGILDCVLSDYRSIFSEIELEVTRIGGTPRSKLPRDFLERIYQLNKEVSRLVSNLVHFRNLIGTIVSRKVPLEGFDKTAEEAFDILQDEASYLSEVANNVTENLHSIIDLYINQASFETNRTLKVLAVITSLSVIPAAIGGLLGENLLDLPFAFYLWQVLLVAGISMAVALYIFIKLGWLKR